METLFTVLWLAAGAIASFLPIAFFSFVIVRAASSLDRGPRWPNVARFVFDLGFAAVLTGAFSYMLYSFEEGYGAFGLGFLASHVVILGRFAIPESWDEAFPYERGS